MSLIKFKSSPVNTNPFDSLFNDFFEGEFFPRNGALRNGSVPAANIQETEKNFLVELAAPGMKKDDFSIELNEDLLTIRSEKKSEKEENGGKFTKREFNYTSFVRSFRLPENVDVESIGANYTDGVLKIEIPKKEVDAKSKVRQISVN